MIRHTVRLLANAARADRRRTLTAAALIVSNAVAAPFTALLLAQMADAVLDGDGRTAALTGLGVAVLALISLTFAHFAHVAYFELAELAEVDFDRQLAALSNDSPGITHHDRPELANRFTVLHRESRQFHTGLGAALHLGGLAVAMVATAVMLLRVDPLLLLLPLAALPPLLAGQRAERILDRARTASAQDTRLARTIVRLATSDRHAGEVRVFGLDRHLRQRHARLWAEATGRLWRGQLRAAAVRQAGQGVFAVAYCAAVLLAIRQVALGTGTVGTLVLVVALAMQVNQQITNAVALVRDLQRIISAYRHVEWLHTEIAAPAGGAGAGAEVPERLRRGVTFDGVSFTHAGAARPALRAVDLTLPAGSTVAVIGENGAGKSTFISLLCGLRAPTQGRILVDGIDQRDLPVDAWRTRISVCFQDFVRYELTARCVVGIGDLPRMTDAAAVRAALARAGANGLEQALPDGLDTHLGTAYAEGAEVSGGQWQKLALGRAFMRPAPLLLVLDEPASALDPEAEHRLVERLAVQARRIGQQAGGITVFVSHRYSTVRSADLIVVLADGGVVEAGDHATLMAAGGRYAEMYTMQANSYR